MQELSMNYAIQNCSETDWEPRFISPRSAEGAKLISELKNSPGVQTYDQIDSQVGEMLRAKYPKKKLKGKLLEEAVSAFFQENDRFTFGEWVYYPWSYRLIHILSEEDFIFTRLSPNNPKITRDEQAVLMKKKVGIVGLSVGQSISLVLSMERICGELRIADYDILELANLNRIRSGLQNMGLNKSVMVAREIMEIDPYYTIRIFMDGMTRENMDAFFHDGGDLDLIVDECDSIDIKVLLREKAKSMQIPVVMDMSDRGTIDIERFDLEPNRPLLHGWIDHLDISKLGDMTNEQKVPYMLPIFGLNTISKRLKASMVEIGESIHTWPQLATSVAMGGALAADTVRRIFLDQFHDSGRYFIDLDELIRDKSFEEKPYIPQTYSWPKLEEKSMHQMAKEFMLSHSWEQGILSLEDADELVGLAAMAPSAGNNQPWIWLYQNGHLFLFHEKSRSYSWTDYDDSLAILALGSAAESLQLAATRWKYICHTFEIFKDQFIAAFRFDSKTEAAPNPLAAGLEIRCSNRKQAERIPVPHSLQSALHDSIQDIPGLRIDLFTDTEKLEAWSKVVGKAEKLRLLDPQGHYEFFRHEIRWTEEEALRTRDGLDVETLELTPTQLAGLEVGSDAAVMKIIRDWKLGDGLEKMSKEAVKSSSALCLISADLSISNESLLTGAAVQRAWIAANMAAWSVHPVSAPLFFINRIQKENNLLDDEISKEIQQLRLDISKITPILHDRRGVFLFRLNQAGLPSKRAIRFLNNEIFVK